MKQLEANLTQHKTALTQERARVQSLIEILKKAKDKHDEVCLKNKIKKIELIYFFR